MVGSDRARAPRFEIRPQDRPSRRCTPVFWRNSLRTNYFGVAFCAVQISRRSQHSSMPKRPVVACVLIVGAACTYLLLGASGMQAADRRFFVAADLGLMLAVSEIIRERG